jgi:hypothetical protein
VIAGLVWIVTPPDPNIPRSPASKKATAEIRELLAAASSLEIVEAGNAIPLRSMSFEGESLKKLAQAAIIVDVEVTNVPTTVVANAYIHFRLMKDDEVLQDYWFNYSDHLVDDSSKHNPSGHWTTLTMSPSFAHEFSR